MRHARIVALLALLTLLATLVAPQPARAAFAEENCSVMSLEGPPDENGLYHNGTLSEMGVAYADVGTPWIAPPEWTYGVIHLYVPANTQVGAAWYNHSTNTLRGSFTLNTTGYSSWVWMSVSTIAYQGRQRVEITSNTTGAPVLVQFCGRIITENDVFGDTLSSEWEEFWSWDLNSFNLNNTTPAYEGSKSVAVNFKQWGGLRLAPVDGDVDTTGLTKLRFAGHGGTTGGDVRVKVQIDGSTYDMGAVSLTANAWNVYELNLPNVPNRHYTETVIFQEDDYTNGRTFYLDSISFR